MTQARLDSRPHRAGILAAGLAALLLSCSNPTTPASTASTAPASTPRALHFVGQLPLPGDASRFDYASLDSSRGLLFIAHLGASEVVEVDLRANRVVRTIGDLPGVHGVLVVPQHHRVYATATAANTMASLDEDTGAVLARTPTGDYPDGLAYDPDHDTMWTSNETGGSESVINASTGAPRGTVAVGGEAGNVAYDPIAKQILVDVQSRNTLAVIDPTTLVVLRQVPLPGCDHDHGLALDAADRLAFIACDSNATVLILDLRTWRVTGQYPVGQDPDVLAYDPAAHRLYVAAESGWLTILDQHDRLLTVSDRTHLADNAHVVAIDPTTGRSYYPVPHGPGGHSALLTFEPTH